MPLLFAYGLNRFSHDVAHIILSLILLQSLIVHTGMTGIVCLIRG